MAVDFGNGPQIKSRAIQGQKVDVVSGGSDNAWGALADGIAKAGDGIAAGINAKASKTDQALDSMDKPKKTNLDKRIDKAKADGNTSKAARLTGKQERRTQRDKERAKRVTQRNKERLAETTRRSEKKTENFTNRRVGDDGKLGTADDKRPFDLMQPFAKKKSKKVEKEINKGNIPKGKSIYYNSATDIFRFGDHEEKPGTPFPMKTFNKFSTIAKKL